MRIDDVPVVIDRRVRAEEMVRPVIADGANNDSLQYARGITPTFEADDI